MITRSCRLGAMACGSDQARSLVSAAVLPFAEARRSRVARAPPCSDAAGARDLRGTVPYAGRAASPEAPTETTQALKQLLAQGPAPTRAGPFAAPLVRHAGRLSRLPEVVDRPGLDVLLQCLERAATGLRHLRDDEDQRDRTDGSEQEEHPGDPDRVDERGEEQREESVRGPPEEHRDADPQAAHVQREDLR